MKDLRQQSDFFQPMERLEGQADAFINFRTAQGWAEYYYNFTTDWAAAEAKQTMMEMAERLAAELTRHDMHRLSDAVEEMAIRFSKEFDEYINQQRD